jgi:putative transposase
MPSCHHKPIRLPPDNYIGPLWHFATICTSNRQPLFRSKSLAFRVLKLLQAEIRHQFRTHAFCLMPDHLHLLAQGNSRTANFLLFIENFKHRTSHLLQNLRQKPLWQMSFYDHILRKRDAPGNVAEYIWLNPVRAGLVARPMDYPFSGPKTPLWMIPAPTGKEWRPPRVEVSGEQPPEEECGWHKSQRYREECGEQPNSR